MLFRSLVGEPDQSIDRLEQLLGIPCMYTPYFSQVDPELISLRALPRFQKLMEKYKTE